MTFEEQRNRYQNDPLFYSVVKILYNFLLEGKITCGELRDAATFAGMLFESTHIKPLLFERKKDVSNRS